MGTGSGRVLCDRVERYVAVSSVGSGILSCQCVWVYVRDGSGRVNI